MNTITQRKAADAAILRELAAKTMGDSAFALNTNNLPDAAKRLRDTLGYVERLMQASGTPGAQPATNAHQVGGEFAGYDINNPFGEVPGAGKATPITGNAGRPADEFDGYDLNAHIEGA